MDYGVDYAGRCRGMCGSFSNGARGLDADQTQTTAGKSDRPALKEDSLAESATGIQSSKL